MDGGSFTDAPLYGEEQAPPSNLELEMALLGAVLVDHRTWDRVIEAVPGFSSAAFFDPYNRIIAETIERFAERGQRIDAKMVAHSLGPDSVHYIGELVGGALNIIDAPDYARTLCDLALARDMVPVLKRATAQVYQAGVETTARDQLTELEAELFQLAERGNAGDGPRSFVTAAQSALQRAQAAAKGRGMVGLSTGIKSLDELTGGLAAPDLIILAGRPGMGKTKLGSRIAFNVARQGHSVIVFSLEMSGEQLATAELSSVAEVDLEDIRRGRLKENQWDRLVKAQAELGGLPIHVDDTPAISPALMRARARRHKRRHGLDLIMVDYLQLMRAGVKGNRNDEITVISQSLKALAKELDVPVLALSQLSRGVEQREDKRPMLSDLRDSGSIEQDADMVWFLFRPAYYLREPQKGERESDADFSARLLNYNERKNNEANLVELNVAKFRQGQPGTVRLFADLATSRFGDLEDRY